MRKRVVLDIAIVLLLLFVREQHACHKAPHIIFMLIDDLGWNDVSFHGSMQIPTPNTDTLAYSGVILNNYYVQPLCTPSRGTLMTGKYAIRLGLQHNVIYTAEPSGLPPTEILLPQHLKQLGYATHGIGKWHLGFFKNEYLPTNRGFDSYWGYWTGREDYFTHNSTTDNAEVIGLDFRDDTRLLWNYTGHYSTEVFTDRAKTIIKNHNACNKPLFLYMSHQAVHTGNAYAPLQAPEDYINKFPHIKDENRRIFAGMVSAMDKSVGEVFTALDDADMLKNSIIIFSSDNGAAVKGININSTGSNWPLRGSKYNLWEGGIRGAAFIWSPLLPHTKGYISESLMHISDWLPTLYAAAGGDIKDLGHIDGHNMWPSLYQNSPSPRDHVLFNIDPVWKTESVRKGQYKLLRGSVYEGEFDGWFDKEGNREEEGTPKDDIWNVQNEIQFYRKELEESEIGDYYLKKFQEPDLRYHACKFNKTQHYSTELDGRQAYEARGKKYPHFLGPPVVVNCGRKLKNANYNCEPLIKPCLFDIEKDPCEYRNLAKFLPLVVQELEDLLDKYRAQAVPIVNKPSDNSAFPEYHGGAWVPWKEKN